MYKKIISLFLVIATVCGVLAVPVSATEALPPASSGSGGSNGSVGVGFDVVDFLDWSLEEATYNLKLLGSIFIDEVCPEREGSNFSHSFIVDTVLVDGVLGDYYVCQYCGRNSGYTADANGLNSAYNQYVSTLPGSVVHSDGSFLIPVPIVGLHNQYNGTNCTWTGHFSPGNYEVIGVVGGTYGWVELDFAASTTPVSGFYTLINEYSPSDITFYYNTLERKNRTYAAAGRELTAENKTVVITYGDQSKSIHIVGKLYYLVEPDVPLGADVFSSNSRPTSIVGDYGIIGDDGTIIKVDGNMIVDESTSTVFNPVTNVTNNYTDYAFDYSDRSYNLTLEDGSTLKVVYGDENVTIHEGDTIYNIYYLIPDDSGSGDDPGSGDTPSGEDMSWWKEAWTNFTDKLFSILGNGGSSSVNPEHMPSVPDDEATSDDDGWTFIDLLVVLKDGAWNVITGVVSTAYDGFYGFAQAVSDSGSFFDYYDPENEQSIFFIPLEEGASVWD